MVDRKTCYTLSKKPAEKETQAGNSADFMSPGMFSCVMRRCFLFFFVFVFFLVFYYYYYHFSLNKLSQKRLKCLLLHNAEIAAG